MPFRRRAPSDAALLPQPSLHSVSADAAWFMVPPTFCMFAAFYSQINALGRVLLAKTCEDMFDSPCNALNEAERHASSAHAGLIISYVMSALSLCSILTTSWLAAASDVVGRRTVLGTAAALLLLSPLGTIVVVQWQWNSWWLTGFYLVAGIGGTFTSFNAAAFAYTADVTTEDARPVRFSILESFVFLGGMAGAIVGAQLLEHVSTIAPFVLSSALYLVVVLYVAVFLPETVAGAHWSNAKRVSWLATISRLLKLLSPCSPKQRDSPRARSRREGSALPWLLVFLAVYSADNEALNLLPLLTRLDNSSAIEMDVGELGLVSAAGSLSKWIVLCVVAPFLSRLLSPRDAPASLIRYGSALGAAVLAPWGYAQDKTVLIALYCSQSIAIISVPAIRSMLSTAHAKVEQGHVLGAISITESVAMFVTPILGGYLWAATVRVNLAPISFVVLGAVVAAASAVSFCLHPLRPVGAVEPEVAPTTATAVWPTADPLLAPKPPGCTSGVVHPHVPDNSLQAEASPPQD